MSYSIHHTLIRRAGALLVTLLLVPLLVACGPREPLSDEEISQRLEGYLQQQAEDDIFSGTVVIAKDGEPIFSQAYGMANKGLGIANTTEMFYALGSASKMFTAVAVGQLAEQGKLSLDDPISIYLPDYPDEVASNVTIAHLLSHTSGIQDFFLADPERHQAVGDSRDPQRDFLPVFADKPLNFEPGTQFEYSNSNFLLLGAIIEQVSGQSYYDYVREQIFEPAGMGEIFWSAQDVATERLALRYTIFGSDGRPTLDERVVVDGDWKAAWGYNPEPAMGGAYGGGYATAGDMLKFLQSLRKHTLLSEEYTDLLFAGSPVEEESDYHYAYGFWVHTAYGQRAVGHGGSGPGLLNEVYMYPGDYDVILLSNYDANEMEDLIARLDDWLIR